MPTNGIAKRRLVWAAVFVGSIPFGVIANNVVAHLVETRRLDAAFEEVDFGMTGAEVDLLMGGGGRFSQPSATLWWGDKRIEGAPTRDVAEVRYSPKRFLFPISFAVQYDVWGRVVGKHRYD